MGMLMALCGIGIKCDSDRKIRKKLSKLMGSLDKCEPGVRCLFELGIFCEVDVEVASEFLRSTEARTCNSRQKRDSGASSASCTLIQGSSLFTPTCSPPVPMKGRQTFRMWKAMIQLGSSPFSRTPSRLDDHPKMLHFLPLEEYKVDALHLADELQIDSIAGFLHKFLQTFFPFLDTILEDRFDIARMNPTSRFHERTKKKQFLVTNIYDRLHSAAGLEKRHYALGLTWTDLYPSEDLNFALGEALYSHRCAVLSFGRYEPKTFTTCTDNAGDETSAQSTSRAGSGLSQNKTEHEEESCSKSSGVGTAPVSQNYGEGFSSFENGGGDGETAQERYEVGTATSHLITTCESDERRKQDSAEEDSLPVTGDLLWKMMRVSSHEVCHLFGLSHCVFFHCSMNESKSVSEALEQPLQLCPVCLRKLQRFLGFDVVTRYRGMLHFCRSVQNHYPCPKMEETVHWLEQVLDFLSERIDADSL